MTPIESTIKEISVRVVELADTGDLKSPALWLVGSSPTMDNSCGVILVNVCLSGLRVNISRLGTLPICGVKAEPWDRIPLHYLVLGMNSLC